MHVLSIPPAFILSQDQTLHGTFPFYRSSLDSLSTRLSFLPFGLTFLSFSLILSDILVTRLLCYPSPCFYFFDEVYCFLKAFKLFSCLGSWLSLSGQVCFALAPLSLQRFIKLTCLNCFVNPFFEVSCAWASLLFVNSALSKDPAAENFLEIISEVLGNI